MIIGYLPGVFDKLHYGHINIIKMAESYCDKLIIGVHTDIMVSSYKRKPYDNENIRKENLKKVLNILDENIILVGSSHIDIIINNNINIIFHGDDWEINSYKKQIRYYEDSLDKLNISILLLEYTKGISTTDIINKNIPNLNNIEYILFDYDNTLILNNKPTSFAIECINFLQEKNIMIKIISNNNYNSPNELHETLIKCGFTFNLDQIITSLHDVIDKIKNINFYQNKKYYIWGSQSAILWLTKYISVTTIDNADIIIILFRKDYTFNDLIYLCTFIKNKKIPYILGNIDNNYPDNNLCIPDTGSLYKLIKSSTNTEPLYICGKPNININIIDKNKCLLVGDNINTDGIQANNLGIKFIHLKKDISHLGVLIDYFNL